MFGSDFHFFLFRASKCVNSHDDKNSVCACIWINKIDCSRGMEKREKDTHDYKHFELPDRISNQLKFIYSMGMDIQMPTAIRFVLIFYAVILLLE